MDLKIGIRMSKPKFKLGSVTERGLDDPSLATFEHKVALNSGALTARSNPGHEARVHKPSRNLLALPAHYVPSPPANKYKILE